MKEYDLAFSLGFACACSQSLRDNGLQTASFPFDWTVTPGLSASVEMLTREFDGWFAREDLVLWDVRISGGYISRVYRDVRQGFVFSHDFTNAEPIEVHYAAAKERYDRRAKRLLARLRAAKRVLAVYVEHPANPRLSDAKLLEAHQQLANHFPGVQIDLLYFFEDPDCQTTESSAPAEGIRAVRMDYRMYCEGVVMHVCNVEPIRAYLRAQVSVPDDRTDDERRAFAAAKRRARLLRYGKTRLSSLINRKLHRLFCNLEQYLIVQRLLPGDRPLRVDGCGL